MAAENASGNVVETNKEGATTIVIAMTLILFLPHQLPCPNSFVHHVIIIKLSNKDIIVANSSYLQFLTWRREPGLVFKLLLKELREAEEATN